MTIGSAMYVHGRKCWFCGNYALSRLADKRIWCSFCRQKYSLNKLKRDLKVLYYFYLEVSARKCANELELSYNTAANRYAAYRKAIVKYSEQEFKNYVDLLKQMSLILEEKEKETGEEVLSTNKQFLES